MAMIEYEVKDKIAYITLNRPEKMNAFGFDMFAEFFPIMDKLDDDPDAWVAIISGRGRAFGTGRDLEDKLSTRRNPNDNAAVSHRVMTVKKPTIAAVHGYCLAQAAGVALSCDIRIAAEGCKFGWPQAKRGIASTSGPCLGTFYLPRNYAFEYLFTGKMFDAAEAYRLNLVNRVVPEDKLMSTAEELAREILECAPTAVWGMKETIILGTDVPLIRKMQISSAIGRQVSRSADAREGVVAFLEKRKPKYTGK